MPFSQQEISDYLAQIEEEFWSKRRPPLDLRDKVREAQRIEGQSIELHLSRPCFFRPGEWVDEPIAKVTYVRSRDLWRIYWQRADGKWHRYPPCPEVGSLKKALQIIDQDAHCCFFG